VANPDPAATRRASDQVQSAPSTVSLVFSNDPSRRSTTYPGADIDDRREPFGMPFTNREVAFVLANELNRRDPGLWFYKVERHIDDKRWIIVREGREFYFRGAMCAVRDTEKRASA
jgi:hypothetical protein